MSKDDLEVGNHIACIFKPKEMDEGAYPAVITEKKFEEFTVRFIGLGDHGTITPAPVSVVFHPCAYSLDIILDDFPRECSTPPARLVRLYIDVPGVDIACRVFLVTTKGNIGLCTETGLFDAVQRGELDIPLPTIQAYKYEINEDGGKWRHQNNNKRKRESNSPNSSDVSKTPALPTTTTKSGRSSQKTKSYKPQDFSPKKSTKKDTSKSNKSKESSPKMSPKAHKTGKPANEATKQEAPTKSVAKKKHKSSTSVPPMSKVLDMEKVAALFEGALSFDPSITFERAIKSIRLERVLSVSGNQSIKQLFEKVKEELK